MSPTSIVAAVALIAILVFIHELGHFLVAKACGVQVSVFSFGFGRRLAGFQWRGTDYRLSLLPVGGYVKMAGADPFGYAEDDGEELEDPSKAFLARPVWQRLAVLIAGPAFNLVLPVVVFTAVLMGGEPQQAAVLGGVEPGSVAEDAGLMAGDRITAVNGAPVDTWRAMAEALTATEGSVSLSVARGERTLALSLAVPGPGEGRSLGVTPDRLDTRVGVDDAASPAGRAGVETGDVIVAIAGASVEDWLAVQDGLAAAADTVALTVDGEKGRREVSLSRGGDWRPVATGLPISPAEMWGLQTATLFIGTVGERFSDDRAGFLSGCRPEASLPSSPAVSAGLRSGDRFLAMDGTPIGSWNQVLASVAATMEGEGGEAEARPMDVAVVRSGEVVHLSVEPSVTRDTNMLGEYYYRPMLGVSRLGGYVDGPTVRVYYPFAAALPMAAEETWRMGTLIVGHLGKMITGEAAVQKSLGGPVEMFRQAGSAAERGLFDWARLMGMLSISLGIINLVPVPVLDGGQILFFAVEGIRGRPLSLALRERAQQAGLLFLVLLMLSVLVFDIQRIFEGPG